MSFFCNVLFCQSFIQLITWSVAGINSVAVSDENFMIVIDDIEGSVLREVDTTSVTYSITTNQAQQKLTASLDLPLPSGITLQLWLEPPNGASATEAVISDTPKNVVENISYAQEQNLTMRYTWTASFAAPVTAFAVTLQLTLADA